MIKSDLKLLMFRGDGNFMKARTEVKKGELDEQLREYINEWRKQRAKEEEVHLLLLLLIIFLLLLFFCRSSRG